jgi:hypothetical protein
MTLFGDQISVLGVAVAVIDGGVPSTVTVKLPVAVLPDESDAEHDTVVTPIANVEPDAGVHVTGTVPSTMSVAVAAKLTTAPAGDVAATRIGAGSDNAGATPSVMVNA